MKPNRNSNAGLLRNSCRLLALSLVLHLTTSTGFGQDADQNSNGQVFDLNPFVVSAQETGWDATETLSGSRLRANFDDVASQLEVMTMEFMDDFAVNSVEEAAIYSLSTENSEEYVPTEDGRQNLSGELRIRGISNATKAREFFASYMAPDNYNLERVTITHGPNAILFGTGSPGGVVNSTLARARFEDEFRSEVQFDDWGGERLEFLANRVLVDDVLALKIAGVWDEQRFSVSPAFEKDRRLYGTLLFKPFKKTSVSIHIEDIRIESRRPARNLPYDRVSVWATSGDLGSIYPNGLIFPNTPGWVTTGRLIIDSRVFMTGSQEPTLLIGQNPDGVPALQSYYNTVKTRARTDFNFGSNNEPLVDPVAVGRNETTLVDGTYYPTDLNQLFYNEGELDEERIYNLFLNQEIFPNLFFEAAWQREEYTDSSGVWMTDTGSTRLQADANRYLPDGVTPNPYAGEYFFEGSGKYERGERERDEYRLSLAYDFDFADQFDHGVLHFLGRHQLSGLYNNRQSESISQEYAPRIIPKFNEATGLYYDPLIPNYPYEDPNRLLLDSVDPLNLSQGSVRTLQVRNYVTHNGEFSVIEPPYDLMTGRPITFVDARGEEWILDPENAAVGTNGERLTSGRNTVGLKDRIVTHQFAYSGYFLNNRLVYTFGYREDELDSADEKAPEWTWLNRETGETQSAGFIAHRSLYGYETFGSPEADNDSGITRYHGVVLHPFRGWSWKLPLGADLSLHYSDSNTFQANTPRLDANGMTVPGEQGEGRDSGFSLSLFNGRFFMRYNDFEVTSSPAIGSFNDIRGAVRSTIRNMLYGFGAADPNGDGIPANRDYDEFAAMWPDWPFLDDPSADPRKVYPFWSSENFATGDFGNELDPYTTISSAVATGREITVGIRPVDNLDIRVTYSEQEVVETGIAGNWIEYIDRFIEFMDSSPSTLFVEGYNAGSNQAVFRNPNGYNMDGRDLDPNDGLPPGIDYFRWDQISNGGAENSRSLTSLSMPWGRDDQSVPGGWTTDTMRERFIADAVNSTRGKAFAQSLEGRPNDFVRQKRFNINAMYSFNEGRLNGTSVGLAYRWREAPAVGVVAVPFYLPDGTQDGFVPDPGNWIKGESEAFWDLTLAYRGKLKLMNNARYTVRLVIRNLFPDDDLLTPRAIDSFTGEVLQQLRLNDRQFVVSFELKI